MKKYFTKIIPAVLILFIVVSCDRGLTLDAVHSSYLKVDSLQIHYKSYGQGEKTLIFVHGWGCDLLAWQYQFSHFKNDYHLVFLDLPGHGKSDKPNRQYTIDLFAESVLAVITELDIKKPVLIAHSMGLPVCIEVVKRLETKEAELCIVDGVYFSFPKDSIDYQSYKAGLNEFADMFKGEDYQQNVEQFAKGFITEKTPPAVRDYILSTMTQTPFYVGYSSMQSLIDENNWGKEILANNTIAIYARTAGLPPDNKNILMEQFPDLIYLEMEDTNHFLMMEKPDEFNSILKNFIDK